MSPVTEHDTGHKGPVVCSVFAVSRRLPSESLRKIQKDMAGETTCTFQVVVLIFGTPCGVRTAYLLCGWADLCRVPVSCASKAWKGTSGGQAERRHRITFNIGQIDIIKPHLAWGVLISSKPIWDPLFTGL